MRNNKNNIKIFITLIFVGLFVIHVLAFTGDYMNRLQTQQDIITAGADIKAGEGFVSLIYNFAVNNIFPGNSSFTAVYNSLLFTQVFYNIFIYGSLYFMGWLICRIIYIFVSLGGRFNV